jgi:hypothetical protein
MPCGCAGGAKPCARNLSSQARRIAGSVGGLGLTRRRGRDTRSPAPEARPSLTFGTPGEQSRESGSRRSVQRGAVGVIILCFINQVQDKND